MGPEDFSLDFVGFLKKLKKLYCNNLRNPGVKKS